LSQHIEVEWEREIHISTSNQCNQTISLVVDVIALYSTSVEDWKTIDCFLFFQEIRELLKKNTETSNRLVICGIIVMIIIRVCTQLQERDGWK